MSKDVEPGGDAWLRPLGSTGLEVSAVTAGGAPLGSMPENFGYEVAQADGVAVVRAWLDSPIMTIDTANGYSGGESERRIGMALREVGGLPPGRMVITKVDALNGDYSGQRVRDSVAESKQRLGLDHLPLVLLHDPEFHDFDLMTQPGGAVEVLTQLRDEGVVGHIGLAGGDVRVMTRYLDLGVFEAILIHNRWTVVDHSASDLIRQARDSGMGVINAAIYGGGILARPHAGLTKYGYRDAHPNTLAAIAAMAELAAEHGTDLASVALQVSLRDPQVDTTVVGFSRPERIPALLHAAGQPLPQELFDGIEALRPDPIHWLDAEQ